MFVVKAFYGDGYSLKTNNNLKASIEGIALSENNKAKYLARAVLSYVFNNSYEVEYLDFENQSGRSASIQEEEATLNSVIEVELEKGRMIQIYPNPTDKELNIVLKGNSNGKIYTYKLLSLLGTELIEGQLATDKINSIEIGNFTKGIFLIQIYESSNLISTQRIISTQ